MIGSGNPEKEANRIKELESYSILDTLPEEDYDNLTAIASQICETHISLVSLIDSKRQWFKSNHGLSVSETPKEYAFCAHAIQNPKDVFIIEDARNDKRFSENPLVTGDPYVIFYAGVPLINQKGFALGTLCVIDKEPKKLSQAQINSLKSLAQQVMNLMELRRTKLWLEASNKSLKEHNLRLKDFASKAAGKIKSPLMQISGVTEIMNINYGDELDTKCQGHLEIIQKSADSLKQMIDDLSK